MCLAASNASAGRIFGDIKLDGKPVPAGLPVEIFLVPPADAPGDSTTPAKVRADSTATDKFGSYKLTVKPEGKCILSLVYEKQIVALDVFSYKEATRYDLILEKKDGKFSLRRK
jgi:hypothetical protein